MRRVGVACPLAPAVPMPLVKAEDVPGRACGVLSPVGDGDEAEIASRESTESVVGDVPSWVGGDMIFQRDGRRCIIRGRGFQLALGTRCD